MTRGKDLDPYNPRSIMDASDSIIGMTTDTVAGDLLGALVQELRLLPDVWVKIPEYEQNEIIDRLRKRTADNVRQAVNLIASEQRITVTADLTKVVFGKDVQAVFTIASRDPAALDLADSRGKACLIVVADPGKHMGGLDEVSPDPDQMAIDGSGSAIIEQARRRARQKPDEDGVVG